MMFYELYTAWQQARKRKKPSVNQARFEARLLDNLLQLEDDLLNHTWQPSQYVSFVATCPKSRQIHAPDFSDRVVHHWLVPQLEAVFDKGFIDHSYSNRQGKGTHKAVAQLQTYIRQGYCGSGSLYYLQCDIHNFFNSIHRATLYGLLKPKVKKHLDLPAQHAVHKLLAKSPLEHGVYYRSSEAERAKVPAHKRLENATKGFGLPIGNLSSQFFANVYMNPLDQFIKHRLKVKRYIRYVDDFVLLSSSRKQLISWQQQIEAFLISRLQLSLKKTPICQPIEQGVDFLGYIIYPFYSVARPRVIGQLKQKLNHWQKKHIKTIYANSRQAIRYYFHGSQPQYQQLQSIWTSYMGHFSHCNHYRLLQRLYQQYPWVQGMDIKRRFINPQLSPLDTLNTKGQFLCFLYQQQLTEGTKRCSRKAF